MQVAVVRKGFVCGWYDMRGVLAGGGGAENVSFKIGCVLVEGRCACAWVAARVSAGETDSVVR